MHQQPQNQPQSWQQAIDTTITCRTLIQYNSNLSEADKASMLARIEETLAFLRQRQSRSSELMSQLTLEPEQLGDLVIGAGPLPQAQPGKRTNHEPPSERDISLQMLSRLQRAYFSEEPGKGMAALEARYKSVMASVAQLQSIAELRRDMTASDLTIEGLIIRIQAFVSELYSIFREFAALFGKVLEGRNPDIHTEAHSDAQGLQREALRQLVRDISPLMHVYTRQREFQRRRGPLKENARDIAAFLIFLQEGLGHTSARRQQVAAELKNISGLLNEMISLLVDYEQAVTLIMQAPSAWQ